MMTTPPAVLASKGRFTGCMGNPCSTTKDVFIAGVLDPVSSIARYLPPSLFEAKPLKSSSVVNSGSISDVLVVFAVLRARM